MKKMFILLGFSGALLAQPAFAVCKLIAGISTAQISINFPSPITVPSNTAIDSVIATAYSAPTPAARYALCTNGGGIDARIEKMGTGISTTNVYPTHLSGIGIRITSQQADGGPGFPALDKIYNFVTRWPNTVYFRIFEGSNYKVELIKTGALTQAGKSIDGLLAKVVLDGGETAVEIRSNHVDVREASNCVISAPSLVVDFGSFGPKAFNGNTGPAEPINFSVTCTSGGITSITAMLSAMPDASNNNAVTIHGAAKGMAIQISDKDSGKIMQPNNLTSTLTKTASAQGAPVNFQLLGTVLKTGGVQTAGAFGAIATINLMYN